MGNKRNIKTVNKFSFNNNNNIERIILNNKDIKITNKDFEKYLNLVSDNIHQNLNVEYLNKSTKIQKHFIIDYKNNIDRISKSKYSIILNLLNKNQDIKWIYTNQYYLFSNKKNTYQCFVDNIFILNNKDIIVASLFDSFDKESFKNNFNLALNNLNNTFNKKTIFELLKNNKKVKEIIKDLDNININFLLCSLNNSFENNTKSIKINDEFKDKSISLIEMEINNHD